MTLRMPLLAEKLRAIDPKQLSKADDVNDRGNAVVPEGGVAKDKPHGTRRRDVASGGREGTSEESGAVREKSRAKGTRASELRPPSQPVHSPSRESDEPVAGKHSGWKTNIHDQVLGEFRRHGIVDLEDG